MENKILLDTSILINLQKGHKPTIKKLESIIDHIVISRITACEFIYGSRDNDEKKINKSFTDKIEIIEINENVSKLAYSLLDKYSLKCNLAIADALIASTCIYHNLYLWTLDIKHFKQIKELNLTINI